MIIRCTQLQLIAQFRLLLHCPNTNGYWRKTTGECEAQRITKSLPSAAAPDAVNLPAARSNHRLISVRWVPRLFLLFSITQWVNSSQKKEANSRRHISNLRSEKRWAQWRLEHNLQGKGARTKCRWAGSLGAALMSLQGLPTLSETGWISNNVYLILQLQLLQILEQAEPLSLFIHKHISSSLIHCTCSWINKTSWGGNSARASLLLSQRGLTTDQDMTDPILLKSPTQPHHPAHLKGGGIVHVHWGCRAACLWAPPLKKMTCKMQPGHISIRTHHCSIPPHQKELHLK